MPTIARGGVLNLVGAAVTALTGVLVTAVITRELHKTVAGTFFALTSVFLLAETLARLGTGTGLVYFVARLRSLGEGRRIRAYQRVALAPVVATSVVTAVVLATLAPVIARTAGSSSAQARNGLLVLAVLLPVAALSDTWLSATRGHATMLPTVVLDKIARPVLQLAAVVAAVAGGSVVWLAGAWALPWLLSAAVGLWWVVRLTRRSAGEPGGDDAPPTRETWREFWRFTGPRAVNSLAQLAQQRLDIVLIAAISGPAPAAVYTAATRFLVVGQQTAVAIATAAQPRLAEVLAVDDRRSASTLYQAATAWVVLLTWPLYLLCALFSGLVLAVFGHGYDAGRPVIWVLAAAMLVSTACGMVDVMLNMAGRTSWTLINSVLSLAVMVGVDLLLIPRMGILGAGIGWALAIVANNVVPLVQLVLALGLHPFGRATVGAAAVTTVLFGGLPGLALLVAPGSPAVAGAAVAVGVTAFVAVCVRWRAALALPTLRSLRRRPVRPLPANAADRALSGGVP